MDALAGIQRHLEEVRRRRALIHLLHGVVVGFALVSFAALTVLIVSGGVIAPTALRVVGALAVFAIVVVAAGSTRRALRRLDDPAEVARVVGRRHPALHSDLLSTVQLSRALTERSARFSPALFAGLADQTWQRLRRIDARSISGVELLKPAAVLASAAAVAWVVAGAAVPEHLARGMHRLIDGPDAPSTTPRAKEPLIGDLSIHYRYPAYTRLEDRRVEGSSGHLRALPGTKVRLVTRALVPFERAAMIVRLGKGKTARTRSVVLRKSAGAAATLTAELTIDGAGGYHVQVERADGTTVRGPLDHRIDVDADLSPVVRLYSPAKNLTVTPQQRIEIGFSAEDDHGLSRVELVYQSRGAARRISLWRSPKGKHPPRSAAKKTEWDLSKVSLEPGVRVAYWIEAWDNDTVSGPKKGSSKSAYVQVNDPEAKSRRNRAFQERLVEDALRALAGRLVLFLDDDPKKAPTPPKRLDAIVAAHGAQRRLVGGLKTYIDRASGDKQVPKATLTAVRGVERRVSALVRKEARLLTRVRRVERDAMTEATLRPLANDTHKAQIPGLEKATLLLADLLDQQRLQGLLALNHRLRDARKRLAELLKRYRNAPTEALRKDILKQIAQMNRRLQKMMAELAALRRRIPDEYLNAEALRGVKLEQDLKRLADIVKQGKLSELDAAMKSLDRKLAAMEQMLAGNLQRHRSGRMSAQEKAYNQMLDKLHGFEREQRAIEQPTSEITERYRKKAAELMRKKIDGFIKRARAQLKKIRAHTRRVQHSRLNTLQRDLMGRATERLDGIEQMLEQKDIAEAADMARRGATLLENVEFSLAPAMQSLFNPRSSPRAANRRHVGKARELTKKLHQALESVLPDPRSMMSKSDRAQMRRLQKRQQALQQRLDKMMKGEGKGKGQRPGGMGKGLGEAGQWMRRASQQLGGMRPHTALGAERQASSSLRKLQKSMREQRMMRQLSPGQKSSREKVEIPDADAFRPPREFRQDILDAMKEAAPPRYRQPVKRYYRDLVQ